MKFVLRFLLTLFFLQIGFSAAIAGPITVHFDDTQTTWPGWGNHSPDDSLDYIGEPDLTGGSATFNSGKLTKLSFGVNTPNAPSSWGCNIQPGDLFIRVGSGSNWNYVVDLTAGQTWAGGKLPKSVGGGLYNIYGVDIPLDDEGYKLSGADNVIYGNADWTGFYIRDMHPVAWAGTFLPNPIRTVYFSGWGGESAYFDFSGLTGGGLDAGSTITIGWTVTCANDVLYETINTPVPEPSTFVFFGGGLVGLAAYIRRGRKETLTGQAS